MIEKNNVNGKIGDKTIKNFVESLDWNLKTLDERMASVREILGEYEVDSVKFYHEYFDEVFNQDGECAKVNLILNKNTPRYDESNIAIILEVIGTYILCSEDEKENRKKERKNYKIYNSKEFEERLKQERDLKETLKINGDNSYYSSNGDNAFDIFLLPKNYKKVKDIVIENEDYKKYPILKDYKNLLDYFKKERKKMMANGLNKKTLKKVKTINKQIGYIKDDMVLIKEKLQRPIVWKSPLPDEGGADWDEYDTFDKKQIKELLRIHKDSNDLQEDLICILYDLDMLIKKINFTEQQYLILNMWSYGMKLSDIANALGMSIKEVDRKLNLIINMIVKQYEDDYTDWYYLNIRKGRYKKCSKCGEIKLVNQFDKNGKKGFYSMCKKCRK